MLIDIYKYLTKSVKGYQIAVINNMDGYGILGICPLHQSFQLIPSALLTYVYTHASKGERLGLIIDIYAALSYNLGSGEIKVFILIRCILYAARSRY
ncbi:hypothetical protein LBYZC6_43590 [Lacrimispora brassicae]